ncbi:molybdenum cofactor guanylyltransferase [Virgibacillus sp. MSJ-26]|uniref:molybdenum cofactor guanylyltransferase n=1 Tax=Virgibacillus sp. MSJ-26 TaxID=2841522 RepID=UPI001C10F840|nr:molybdenum cofactor guanylyltransferase [Virgibacillus sp. MSJ-26]MBU5466639.1 molybdenum cofactor guanylyltransferase [Virgibacillus sp. MSJ-26]
MNTCGVILSGGKSSRMGTNKALLTIDNKTVIETIAEELQLVSDKIIVVTNEPADYKFLNLPLVSDRYPNKGPLAGIETAMYHFEADHYIISACDMPFINHHVYQYLLDNLGIYDAIVPEYDDQLHPLSGIFRRNALNVIKSQIERGNLRVKSFFDFLNVKFVKKFNDIDETLLKKHFFNMNNPEEYQQARGY